MSSPCAICDKAIPAARQEVQPRTVTCSSECSKLHAARLRRQGARRQGARRQKQGQEEREHVQD